MIELEQTYFPMWRLGYRCNPFRTLTREEWRELAVLPEGLHTLIHSLPPLTQILGDQGRGKTSALLALEREINHRGWPVAYEYLPPGTKRYTQDPSDLQVFLLDEAQRLSRRSLKKLLKMVSANPHTKFRLIISTHADLTGLTLAHGISIQTLTLSEPSPEFIQSLIELRLCFFESPGHQGVRLAPNAESIIRSYCGSDLRLLEKLLYEVYQTWNSENSITATHVRGLLEDGG